MTQHNESASFPRDRAEPERTVSARSILLPPSGAGRAIDDAPQLPAPHYFGDEPVLRHKQWVNWLDREVEELHRRPSPFVSLSLLAVSAAFVLVIGWIVRALT